MPVNYHNTLHNYKLLESNLLCFLQEKGGSQLQHLILSWYLNVYAQYGGKIWLRTSWH